MGKKIIYLINADNSERYKIGITSRKNLNHRLRNLQTGCSDKLNVIKTYETDYASLIEKTLHREFAAKQLMGEWFFLEINDVLKFEERCKIINNSIELLKNVKNDFILKTLHI